MRKVAKCIMMSVLPPLLLLHLPSFVSPVSRNLFIFAPLLPLLFLMLT